MCWWHRWLSRRGRTTKLAQRFDEASTAYSIEISAQKTKLMINKISGINKVIKVNGEKLETVTSFKNLGSVIIDEGSPGLSNNWWGFQAWDTLQDSPDNSGSDKVETSLNDRSIFLSSKIRLMRSLVTSIFLHACELWTLTAELQRRIQAMEMGCYRKILCISYRDHVSNEEVRAKIQQAIGSQQDLLTLMKRRKLQWYGHVSRSSGLTKPSRKAQWKGEEDKADKGRSGKTTSGNGQAWTSPSTRGQLRTGKNEGSWIWSLVVSQQPLKLRDRWR